MATVREVVVDRKVYDRFKRRAFSHYPKECAELLWGAVDGSKANICVIEPAELNFQTRDGVDFDFDQPCGSKHSGLTLLGSLHTHAAPYDRAEPSEDDLNSSIHDGEIVWGICAIRKKSERRFAACRFWNTGGGELEFVVAE